VIGCYGNIQLFAKDARGLHEVIGKLPKEKRARQDLVLAAMRAEIKKGMWRDRAIYAARQLDVGLSAIGDALGLSRIQIWRILVLQGAPERELKERANKHRKERERIGRQAMDALRLAIARSVPRDQAMAEAYKAGLTLRAIGDMYGLTRERIRQIIDGARGARGESDVSAKRSGAAMYPAFECSRFGCWP
jgi:hypothetical protein